MQRTQVRELMPQVFNAHAATPVLQALAERLEGVDMAEGDRLWNLDVKALRGRGVCRQFVVDPVAKVAVGYRGHRQIDRQRVRCAVEPGQGERNNAAIQRRDEL